MTAAGVVHTVCIAGQNGTPFFREKKIRTGDRLLLGQPRSRGVRLTLLGCLAGHIRPTPFPSCSHLPLSLPSGRRSELLTPPPHPLFPHL